MVAALCMAVVVVDLWRPSASAGRIALASMMNRQLSCALSSRDPMPYFHTKCDMSLWGLSSEGADRRRPGRRPPGPPRGHQAHQQADTRRPHTATLPGLARTREKQEPPFRRVMGEQEGEAEEVGGQPTREKRLNLNEYIHIIFVQLSPKFVVSLATTHI